MTISLRALHNGIAPNGARYYPAFPYPNFTRMTRDDVLAIHAYLATLAPVHSTRPPPGLRWPYKYRVLMRGLGLAVLSPAHLHARIRTRARNGIAGAYLVRGVAHCGACP